MEVDSRQRKIQIGAYVIQLLLFPYKSSTAVCDSPIQVVAMH